MPYLPLVLGICVVVVFYKIGATVGLILGALVLATRSGDENANDDLWRLGRILARCGICHPEPKAKDLAYES